MALTSITLCILTASVTNIIFIVPPTDRWVWHAHFMYIVQCQQSATLVHP